MKIHGSTPGANAAEHLITRPGLTWKVRLTAMPYGFPERIDEELPEPVPPVEFGRDERGKILRDADGQAVTYRKTDDEAYRKAVARRQALRSIYVLWKGLQGDPAVSFEADRARYSTTAAWLADIERELLHAGLADGEIVEMVSTIWRLGRGFVQGVEQAADSFLPTTPSPAGLVPPTPAAPTAT